MNGLARSADVSPNRMAETQSQGLGLFVFTLTKGSAGSILSQRAFTHRDRSLRESVHSIV